MKGRILLLLGVMMGGWLAAPQITFAQEDEGPGSRVVTITSWDVPYGERTAFWNFFMDRVLPNSQLNPNVINSRILLHQWGSNADQIIMINEYADMAAVAAECGAPCSEYFEANPPPQEGDEGYEQFQAGQQAFSKYYSRHTDEIYNAPMMAAKVEGEVMGTVGIPDDDE